MSVRPLELGKRALLVLFCVGTLPAVAAPEGETRVSSMSLPEVLEYARQHQPSLRAAQARAQAALAQTFVPRAQWFPRIGATAQVFVATANNTSGTYVGAGGVDLPRIGDTPTATFGSAGWTPYGASIAAVGLRQEVFDFGKIAAQSAVVDALATAQASHTQAVELDLKLAVKNAYFAVLAAKAILSASEAAYQRSLGERNDAAARVKAGMRSPVDLTRPEADLMRFDAGRIRARGSVATAQAVLAAIAGFPEGRLDASTAAPPGSEPPEQQESLRRALEQAPEVQEYLARLSAQRAVSKDMLLELLPDLFLTGTFSGRAGGAQANGNPPPAQPPGSGFVPGVPNWDLGLVLSWQLYDQSLLERRKVSQRNEEAASADLDAVRLSLSSAIQQAYCALDVALEALPALRRAVDAAHANRDQVDARFKVGLGTAVELADADAVLTEAEIQVALGQFEADRARARLARAIAEP
jgi:outer membrane protein TolC